MKLEDAPRFTPEQYPGMPDWFKRYGEDYARWAENVTRILQSGITNDNENIEVYALEVYHDTTFTLDTTHIAGDPVDLTVEWAQTTWTGLYWEQTDVNEMQCKILFDGAPTAKQEVRVRVRGSS